MLYQDKQNNVKDILDLKECIELAEKEGLRKLTDKQLKAYENKPEFGTWNGKEWIADNDKIEKVRVESINDYTQSFIYSKYPQPKQSSANLGVYDEAYKNEMVAFIKRVVGLSNDAIANGTSLENYKVILGESEQEND